MFLASESLAELLSGNADVIRLALFGHTHADEMRLLTAESFTTNKPSQITLGVPLKIVASITPIDGNRPSFTLAAIDPASATLADYTVFLASNSTGMATTWSKEYTYSTTYHQPAFDSAALSSLIPALQADHAIKTAASQAYLSHYSPGNESSALQFVWPQYACTLDHDSAASFSACACGGTK
jgi:sphingomyelin phosphodiesterase acid-like 3